MFFSSLERVLNVQNIVNSLSTSNKISVPWIPTHSVNFHYHKLFQSQIKMLVPCEDEIERVRLRHILPNFYISKAMIIAVTINNTRDKPKCPLIRLGEELILFNLFPLVFVVVVGACVVVVVFCSVVTLGK